MKDFSFKRALGWSGAGIGIAGLTATFQAFAHHARHEFDSLTAAFAHVVTPESAAITVGICVAVGAGIEAIKQYHRSLDTERVAEKPENKEGAAPGPR